MKTLPAAQKQVSYICHLKMQTHKTQDRPLVCSHNYQYLRYQTYSLYVAQLTSMCCMRLTLAVHGHATYDVEPGLTMHPINGHLPALVDRWRKSGV